MIVFKAQLHYNLKQILKHYAMSKSFVPIPVRHVGPIALIINDVKHLIRVPLATFETPVWHAVARGAKLSRNDCPIHSHIISNSMSRSILFDCESVANSIVLKQLINSRISEIKACVATTSQWAELEELHFRHLGNKLYCRLSFSTALASGHNMTTKAADAIGQLIQSWAPFCRFMTVSGNLCTDKKVSSINPTLGRGKHVIAEMTLPEAIVKSLLHTTPEAIIELHVNKNLNGSILAGSLHSANAHAANTLLAFYLATGQDAANIVEGSQAIVHAELTDNNDLYFSVSLPSIIVGSIGAGKNDPVIRNHIQALTQDYSIDSSEMLAHACASAVLCSELSLLAAQTQPGELVRSHMILERRNN